MNSSPERRSWPRVGALGERRTRGGSAPVDDQGCRPRRSRSARRRGRRGAVRRRRRSWIQCTAECGLREHGLRAGMPRPRRASTPMRSAHDDARRAPVAPAGSHRRARPRHGARRWSSCARVARRARAAGALRPSQAARGSALGTPARAGRGTSPTRAAAAPAAARRARARRRPAAPRASTPSRPRRHSSASHVAQLLVRVGGVEQPPDDELRRDGAVPAVLLEPERDVEAALGARAARAAPPSRTRSRCRRRGRAGGRGSAGACPRRPSRASTASQPATSSVTSGIAEPERREPVELLRQLERERRRRARSRRRA